MADQHDLPSAAAFRVCLNGFTVRECRDESEALGSAIELKRSAPSAKITVINVRAGLVVEVASGCLEKRPGNGERA